MTEPFAAVAGWPANHSISPVMMKRWLEDAGIQGQYGRVEVPAEHFPRFASTLPELGWIGVNVTVPHKGAALKAAHKVSEAAQQIGAANLLTVSADGNLKADNTDVVGIAEALAGDEGHAPAALIGAGGAAAAALHHLAAQDRDIRIINRTRAKAEKLASQYDRPITIEADLEKGLAGASVVINATSLGMVGQPRLEPDLGGLADNAVVFDMVYAPLNTPLLQAARRSGHRAIDGLTMLIGQARPSFEALFGQPVAEHTDMRAHLLAHLKA